MIITFLGHGSLYNCDGLFKKIKKAIEDNIDLIVAYVEYTHGGDYKSLCYAKKKGKHIINLADKKT